MVSDFVIRKAIMFAVAFDSADTSAAICTTVARSLSQEAWLTNGVIAEKIENLVEQGLLKSEKTEVGEGEFKRKVTVYSVTEIGQRWVQDVKVPI